MQKLLSAHGHANTRLADPGTWAEGAEEGAKVIAGQELKPGTGDRLARGEGGLHILPTGVWASWKQAGGSRCSASM